MNIILGYDIVTYNGVLPNCLDPKFIPTIYEATKFIYNKSHLYFYEKWGNGAGRFFTGYVVFYQ